MDRPVCDDSEHYAATGCGLPAVALRCRTTLDINYRNG